MKKFSFALLAAAALSSHVLADDAAPAEKPPVCPIADAAVCQDAQCAHEPGHDAIMTTMIAVPEGELPVDAGLDPSIMSMTGIVDDTATQPPREEGENFRDLSVQTLGGGARFEGLTQVAADRRGFGSERTSAGDKSSLKSLLFGKKVDARAKATLVANERAAMQKMAEVDQLRDKALKTGDTRLLARADAMEQELKVGAKPKSKFSLFGRK